MTRIGLHVDGNKVGDRHRFLKFASEYQPDWVVITGENTLIEDLRKLDTWGINIIKKSLPSFDANIWKSQEPKEFANAIIANSSAGIWNYVLNRPVVRDIKDALRFSKWLSEVIAILSDNGCRSIVGNIVSEWLERWQIEEGGFDLLLKSLIDRRENTKLGVQEFSSVILPYGLGPQDRWELLSSTGKGIQIEEWPNSEEIKGILSSKELLSQSNLLKSRLMHMRSEEITGQIPDTIVSEFGWFRNPDWVTGQNHIYDALLKRYGMPKQYSAMQGPYSLASVWAYYYPDQSTAQSIVQQLKWADSIYPQQYLGILLYTWSVGTPDERNGVSYAQDEELQSLLVEWARSERGRVEEDQIKPEKTSFYASEKDNETIEVIDAAGGWEEVEMSSVSEYGTNVRQKPSKDAFIVGRITSNTPALLRIGYRKVADDAIWCNVKINANGVAGDNDFSNEGWVRKDAVTYKRLDYTPQMSSHLAPDETQLDVTLIYDKSDAGLASLAKMVKEAVEVFVKFGGKLGKYEETAHFSENLSSLSNANKTS